jgi:hypothetical protein
MPRRVALIAAIVTSLLFCPTRLSAQQKYVGLSLCSAELQSPRSRLHIRLDRTQHAYVEYREMPTARLVMIVVYADDFDKDHCGSVRDAREFHYSKDGFDPECIELLHPENVVVGFFDQKFDPDHLERPALMRGPAVQSWRIDLKNLKFLPTSGQVTCVVPNGHANHGNDDGSDLATWAHQRVMKKNSLPVR